MKISRPPENQMRPLGALLVVAGILAFMFGGFSYLRDSRSFEAGPLQISWRRSVPIPPIVGIVAVVAGGVVLLSAGRNRRHA